MYRTTDGLGLAGATITNSPLPAGDQGTRKTVAEMQRLVSEGSRDMVVREAIVRTIQGAGIPSHDFVGQATAWFHWVATAITFVNDPLDSEWLQSPRVTLNLRAGDCDDRTILLAAGLAAIGIPSRFKLVATNSAFPGTFSHVYLEANLGGRWTPMDPTYPNATLGGEPPRASRVWRVPAWRTA